MHSPTPRVSEQMAHCLISSVRSITMGSANSAFVKAPCRLFFRGDPQCWPTRPPSQLREPCGSLAPSSASHFFFRGYRMASEGSEFRVPFRFRTLLVESSSRNAASPVRVRSGSSMPRKPTLRTDSPSSRHLPITLQSFFSRILLDGLVASRLCHDLD